MLESGKDEARRVLTEAWRAIHAHRFDASQPGFSGPDSYYHGVQTARNEILEIATRYDLSVAELHHDTEGP